jgi:hypothetical protein
MSGYSGRKRWPRFQEGIWVQATEIFYQLGVYLNKEIGKVFGVGYTAVPGAVKRGEEYLKSDGWLKRVVNKIIADI